MTADDFRQLALSLPEAIEWSHMGHPDFRVRKKIFATLGFAGDDWGMVKLSPAQQRQFVRAEPTVFKPVKGGWGQKGATKVMLESATKAVVRPALIAAWKNVAPKRLVDEYEL